jgi:hypothetical protein
MEPGETAKTSLFWTLFPNVRSIRSRIQDRRGWSVASARCGVGEDRKDVAGGKSNCAKTSGPLIIAQSPDSLPATPPRPHPGACHDVQVCRAHQAQATIRQSQLLHGYHCRLCDALLEVSQRASNSKASAVSNATIHASALKHRLQTS